MLSKKGFTLIELLIVVAIIALIAAVAIPNFLEAQTRAKVSRVRADLRATALGIEVYAVDHNAPPPVFGPVALVQFPWEPMPKNETIADRYHWMTSPVAYLTAGPFPDVFVSTGGGRLRAWQRFFAILGNPATRSQASKATTNQLSLSGGWIANRQETAHWVM